jgi:hypothetical protein
MSLRLRRVIMAYDRGRSASGALRIPLGFASHDCTLEAMRTQSFPLSPSALCLCVSVANSSVLKFVGLF